MRESIKQVRDVDPDSNSNYLKAGHEGTTVLRDRIASRVKNASVLLRMDRFP